ncbi:hypothetical protein N9O24_00375 [bacterium]|nr:hypothetical protein [bacterium]
MSPATVDFSKGRKTVFACAITTQQITEGEEITISYGDGIKSGSGHTFVSPNSVLEKLEKYNYDPIRPQVDGILHNWLITGARRIIIKHDLSRLGITSTREGDVTINDKSRELLRSLYPDLTPLDAIIQLSKKLWISDGDVLSSLIYF